MNRAWKNGAVLLTAYNVLLFIHSILIMLTSGEAGLLVPSTLRFLILLVIAWGLWQGWSWSWWISAVTLPILLTLGDSTPDLLRSHDPRPDPAVVRRVARRK